jgi:hypothetical protein
MGELASRATAAVKVIGVNHHLQSQRFSWAGWFD